MAETVLEVAYMNDQFGYQPDEFSFQTGNFPPANPPTNSRANTALILGIIAIAVSCLCCCIFPVGFILGVLAIVFAVRSKDGSSMTGKATAGMILGIIAILICIVLLIGFILEVALAPDVMNSYDKLLVPPTDLDSLRSHIEALEQWCQQMGYDISFADIYEQIDAQSLQ